MNLTEDAYKAVQQERGWCDDDLNRFKDFIETYPEALPDDWALEDIADAIAIFDNEHQAFWFIEEGQDYADIAIFLSQYDLSHLKEGQTNLAQHMVEEHHHYYKVQNGYVFFSE